MRRFFTLFTTAALLVTPAIAQARGFDSDFSQTITGPLKLEIVVSDDLAHRANNLPEELKTRRTRGLNKGFANNGFYGDRDVEYLVKDMTKELSRDLAKRGIALSDTASTVLLVTIVNAKPNRPTAKQLSKDANLSFNSFGTGGAEISAEISSAGGEVIGQANYDYYGNLADNPFPPIGTWEDAERAFDYFSRSLSKKLVKVGAAGTG